MKTIKNIKTKLVLLCVVALSITFVSCDEDLFAFELPEAGSIEDVTPPSAAFTYLADPAGFTVINFTNTSADVRVDWRPAASPDRSVLIRR